MTYCKFRSDLAASKLQSINIGENVRVYVCPTDFNRLSSSAAWQLKNANNYKNQSHYRPEMPRGFQEVKVPRLRDSGTGLCKVVSLTHRPLFTPRKYSWYSFLLETESTPGS